jgi:uncharacterized membrane protein YdfJ with MMPL/SSD domain
LVIYADKEILFKEAYFMGVKIGKGIVKFRVPIFIISLILLIPAAIGYLKTKVNYDILSYLPKDIETMVGQDIMLDEFGTGAFSMVMVEIPLQRY